MKKIAICLSFLLFVASGFAKDKIYLKNGEIINSEIIASVDFQVKFLLDHVKNADERLFVLDKSEILMIIYDDGKIERYLQLIDPYQMPDSAGFCQKGATDAHIYYKASGPFWGTLCCTGGLNPVFGVILAAVSVSSEPKEKSLKMPVTNDALHPDYQKCYREEAYVIKKKKVWTAFGIGTGIYAIFLVIYLAAY